MDIKVCLASQVTPEDSLELESLGAMFAEEFGVSVKPQIQEPIHGSKDGGLTIGLAIGGLAASALSSIIGLLSYWRSTRPKYSITVVRGETKIEVDNIDPRSASYLLNEISRASSNNIEINVTKSLSR